MKLLISCLLFISLQASSLANIPTPSLSTQKVVLGLFNKFAKDHHVPCLVGGYWLLKVSNGSVHGESSYQLHNDDGLADVENKVPCSVDTVLRVASVSKAIGSGLVASLVEQGKLHWDDDVNKYVSEKVFPKKTVNGKSKKSSIILTLSLLQVPK